MDRLTVVFSAVRDVLPVDSSHLGKCFKASTIQSSYSVLILSTPRTRRCLQPCQRMSEPETAKRFISSPLGRLQKLCRMPASNPFDDWPPKKLGAAGLALTAGPPGIVNTAEPSLST